jgi:hypothetical protein
MVEEMRNAATASERSDIEGGANYSWFAGLGFLTIGIAVPLLRRLLPDLTSFQQTAFLAIEIVAIIGFFAASIDWVRYATASTARILIFFERLMPLLRRPMLVFLCAVVAAIVICFEFASGRGALPYALTLISLVCIAVLAFGYVVRLRQEEYLEATLESAKELLRKGQKRQAPPGAASPSKSNESKRSTRSHD